MPSETKTGKEIRCTKCSRLLAVQYDAMYEIRQGAQVVRVYRAELLLVKCERCGQMVDVMN